MHNKAIDYGDFQCKIKKTPIKKQIVNSIKKYWLIYFLLLPGVISLIIFVYGPMLLQVVMTFTKYRLIDGVFGSKFVGFANFNELFTELPEFNRLITNTVILSIYYMISGFFPPIILAVFFFDLSSNRLRKVSQTIVYIPYFFSWVIVYGICYGLLSNTGLVNSIIMKLGGDRTEIMMSADHIRSILVITNVWKNVGWGTIIYLASMMNVDTSLFDVAKLDGCGPIRRTFVVTIPGIKNILIFQMMMSLGGILSGGNTEQILLFYSTATWSKADTIGTWMYRQGLRNPENYSLAASFSFIQAMVGMIIVVISNKLSTKYAKVGIW